jgi:hypothetical protein
LSLATWGVRNLGVQSPTTQQRNGPGGGFRAREGKVREGAASFKWSIPWGRTRELGHKPCALGCSQELLSPAG